MINKTPTPRFATLKNILILPVVAIAVYAFATPEYKSSSSPDSKTSVILQKEIKGIVLSEDGKPLAGAIITSTGTMGNAIGVISGSDGSFVIKAQDDASLLFNCRGYKRLTVKPVFTAEMKVRMETDPEHLGLPTGGMQPKPLIIVDGNDFTDSLNKISPNDINSVAILKGISATKVFGEKGKDGVIVITTKAKKPDNEAPVMSKTDYQEQLLSKSSDSLIIRFIYMTVVYPQVAKEASDTGKVFVVVKLNKGGVVKECEAFTEGTGIKVPILNEVVIVGYGSSTGQGVTNKNAAAFDHPALKAECLRVANSLTVNEVPEWKDKNLEFALAFKFLLK